MKGVRGVGAWLVHPWRYLCYASQLLCDLGRPGDGGEVLVCVSKLYIEPSQTTLSLLV